MRAGEIAWSMTFSREVCGAALRLRRAHGTHGEAGTRSRHARPSGVAACTGVNRVGQAPERRPQPRLRIRAALGLSSGAQRANPEQAGVLASGAVRVVAWAPSTLRARATLACWRAQPSALLRSERVVVSKGPGEAVEHTHRHIDVTGGARLRGWCHTRHG